MVMVKYFPNTPASTLGDLACAFRGAYTDVLARHRTPFADIAGGVERVKCHKVACTFPNTLGCCSSTFGGSFADISGALTDVSTGTALMALPRGGSLRCVGGLRCGLGLAVLTGSTLDTDGKCECQERSGCFLECGSHGLNLSRLDSAHRYRIPSEKQRNGKKKQRLDHAAYPQEQRVVRSY